MCGRFGNVLGSAHSTPDELTQIALATASSCEAFGEELPGQPVSFNTFIGYGCVDPDTYGDLPDTNVKSCKNCSYCVDVDESYTKLGYAVPICVAKGKLILKSVGEATDCNFRTPKGEVSVGLHDINIFDWLQHGFKMPNEEAIKQYVTTTDFIDPEVYPTDREVTVEEAAKGIRALRRVFNPDGSGRYRDLPIFKRENFAPEDQLLIPQTGDENHPELYVDYNNLLYQFAVDGYTLHETAALVGPPGVGKTQFALWLAWLCQVPFVRIQFQAGMDVVDLLGQDQLDGTRTFFDPGQLPTWYQKICVLLCDEPNLGPNESWQVMRPLADGASKMWIQKHCFHRDEFCMFLMAMNPSWDPRNIGTNALADADGNRLSFFAVDEPPEPVERHIIQTYCKQLDDYDIPDSILDTIIEVGKDIRAASESGTFPGTWETRQQIKVARKSRWYDLAQAYKIAALNNLEPSVREVVLDSLSTHTEEVIRRRATDNDVPF